MTCHLSRIAAVAAESGRCITSAPREGNVTGERSTPAETMPTPPGRDGTSCMIAGRANRLRHSNDVQRQRFMDLHQALSRHCSAGDA